MNARANLVRMVAPSPFVVIVNVPADKSTQDMVDLLGEADIKVEKIAGYKKDPTRKQKVENYFCFLAK